MLLSLPQEVILDVASHLEFSDKINLMTTCKVLHLLISDRSLYEVLSFYGNKEQTEEIIEKFKNNQFNGQQVKKLELKLDCLSDQVYSTLPEVFPNINRLFDYSDQSDHREREDAIVNSFLKWKDKIEYSGTSEDRFTISRLLEKTVFSRLTGLDITLSYHEYNDGSNKDSDIRILACVENAPLLKRLRLYGCKMNLTLLEEIHDACPQLISLTLEGYLEINQSTKAIVRPVHHLSYLSLGWELLICDRHCVFLDYIVEKYPNLKHLLFFPTFAKYMANYALHKFYSDEFNDNGFDGAFITSLRDDFEYTCDAYRSEGGTRFLSKLPRSIKTLEIEAVLFDCIIPSLEQTQINPFTLLFQKRFDDAEVFQQPHELSYLRSLTLLKKMKVTLTSSMRAYDDGIVSSSLTKLTVSIKGEGAFDVGWLLSIFPSLEDLDIEISSAILVGENKTVVYPRLKKLRVEECLIHPDLLSFITTVAPNIEQLAWSILGESYQKMIIRKSNKSLKVIEGEKSGSTTKEKNYHIDVTKLNKLEKFNLQINRGQDDADREYDIYGEIKIQNHTRKLVFSENFKPALEVTGNEEQLEDLEKMSKVMILCEQIKRIKINYNIWLEKEGDNINLLVR